MARDGVKAVRMLYAAFNNGDFEGMTQNLHPEVELTVRDVDASGTEEGSYRGIDEIRRLFESINERVVRPYFDVRVVAEERDRVIASITIRGTLRTNSAPGSMPAVHVFSFEDGKIRQLHVYRPPWEQLAPESAG